MTDRPNNQDAEVAGSVHPGEDELSAYINGDITDLEDLEWLQAHLETCANCRETLSELRAVVWLLQSAENPVPSRSFRLDPSMVGAQVARIDPWIVRIQPALRRLTAIAAVVLFFLVAADVLVHQNAREGASQTVSDQSFASQSASGSSSSGSTSSGAAPALSEATAASAANQLNSASPAAAAAASTESTKASQAETPQTTASTQPGATDQSAPGLLRTENPVTNTGTSYWRLVELAVGVVVIWLLFLTVALPRLVRQREP